jgi:hypothetical protein
MVFFAPLLMHAWVLFDRRQCLVSYVSCSAQDEEVYDHERVDEHEGYPHECAYRRHEVYQPRLYTRIVTLAAKTGLDAACPPDACEEAVFGEDGYGIDEEHGNVEEATEAEEGHFRFTGDGASGRRRGLWRIWGRVWE